MINGQGEMEKTPEGAHRESNKGRGRFDLLPYEALEAWAIWSEEGAEKYGERNWEAGLSVKDCINRLVRHACKAANGWTDEPHLAACMWNAAAAITMIARRPDCNDHLWQDFEGSTNVKKERCVNLEDIIPPDEYQVILERFLKRNPEEHTGYVLSEKEAKKRQDAINKHLEEEKFNKADTTPRLDEIFDIIDQIIREGHIYTAGKLIERLTAAEREEWLNYNSTTIIKTPPQQEGRNFFHEYQQIIRKIVDEKKTNL